MKTDNEMNDKKKMLDYNTIIEIMDSCDEYNDDFMKYTAGIIIACAYCDAITNEEFGKLTYRNCKKHFDYMSKRGENE